MTTTVLGIFGHPVGHSKSPAMHNAAIEALGLNARYLPFAVTPDALGDAVRGLRALGIRGVNVTLPHKQAVMPLLDAIDPGAAAIGAVNTVVNEGGFLTGYNTDAGGLCRSLEVAGVELAGRRVCVVGAGGAGRAAAYGLGEAGARSVHIVARRADAALDLAEALRPHVACELGAGGLDGLSARFAETDLLVQATSATLGETPAAEEFAASLPIDALPASAAVVDLVYQPLVTSVLRRADARGLVTVDGLGMLLYQGALAFERFLGVDAPVEVMARALGRPLSPLSP